MSNNFFPQAVEIVRQAIELDNLGEYEKALGLYKRSLEYFMTGLKYESNPTTKKTITERITGYLKRAEEIKVMLDDKSVRTKKDSGGGGGAKTLNKEANKDIDKDGEDKAKMRGALSSAIISEKPILSGTMWRGWREQMRL